MLNWIVDHTYQIIGVIMLLILMLVIALYNAPLLIEDITEDDQP